MSTTQLAERKDRTIKNFLTGNEFKLQVERALPRHLSADRFIRIALTALTRTPKLQECTQESFFKCLLDLSAMGLEPDGRRAHLIPYNNRKQGIVECQLIVDYKGLVELVLNSNEISKLHSDVVRENDIFEYDKGEIKTHRIDFRKPRGEAYAVYSLARDKDGVESTQVLSIEEVESVRGRSKAANDGPWVTDWAEMAKKTAFRRLTKWLKLSAELRDKIEKDDEPTEQERFEAAKPVSFAEALPGKGTSEAEEASAPSEPPVLDRLYLMADEYGTDEATIMKQMVAHGRAKSHHTKFGQLSDVEQKWLLGSFDDVVTGNMEAVK